MDLIKIMQKEVVNSELPTKKELVKKGKEFSWRLADSGEYNLQEVYANALRLKESINTVEAELKNLLPQEDFEGFGLKCSYRQGGNTINYKDDPIYQVMLEDLEQRKELLKLALKSKDPIFDAYGNEVPKVSTTPRKSSLAMSF